MFSAFGPFFLAVFNDYLWLYQPTYPQGSLAFNLIILDPHKAKVIYCFYSKSHLKPHKNKPKLANAYQMSKGDQ